MAQGRGPGFNSRRQRSTDSKKCHDFAGASKNVVRSHCCGNIHPRLHLHHIRASSHSLGMYASVATDGQAYRAEPIMLKLQRIMLCCTAYAHRRVIGIDL